MFKPEVAALDTYGTPRQNPAKVCAHILYGKYIKGLLLTKSIRYHWAFNWLKYYTWYRSTAEMKWIKRKWKLWEITQWLNINLHSVFSFLLECTPAGYFGSNCSEPCPYPYYGDGCRGTCKCDKNSCDVSTGCRPRTTGTHITFLSPQTTNFKVASR